MKFIVEPLENVIEITRLFLNDHGYQFGLFSEILNDIELKVQGKEVSELKLLKHLRNLYELQAKLIKCYDREQYEYWNYNFKRNFIMAIASILSYLTSNKYRYFEKRIVKNKLRQSYLCWRMRTVTADATHKLLLSKEDWKKYICNWEKTIKRVTIAKWCDI